MSVTAGGTTHSDQSHRTIIAAHSSGAQQTATLNQSLKQFGASLQAAGMGSLLAGQQINVEVTASDGSTTTRGLIFESNGDISISRTGFANPAVTTSLAEATLDSVIASGEPGFAVTKAIKYDLVTLSGSGADQLLTSVGIAGVKQAGQTRIAAADVDVDDDGIRDAVLEIEAIDDDADGVYDRLVRTVIRDIDNDGTLETVDSSTRQVAASVSGSVTLDLTGDDSRDTLLRLTGVDTDADGQLDHRRAVTLLDTRGDEQFDVYSETVGPITPAMSVGADWRLTQFDDAHVRLDIEGIDSNGDDRFDRKVLVVALDLDGEPGFESSSETTARINPSLRISAEFDTDGDGTSEAKANLAASDSNDDGALDSRTSTVVNDSDGDGTYDSVVARNEYQRGFISNSGESIQYLDDPQNLTIIGVLVSVLGIILQLVQGG